MIGDQGEPGVVDNVRYGLEDHGILTCSVGVRFKGSYQAFGNLCLDEAVTGPVFARELLTFFGLVAPVVHNRWHEELQGVVGLECVALRCKGGLNDPIEGLERDGKRFTLTGFRRRHWPDKVASRLEEHEQSIKREIGFLRRRIREEEAKLATLRDGFVEWETAP